MRPKLTSLFPIHKITASEATANLFSHNYVLVVNGSNIESEERNNII